MIEGAASGAVGAAFGALATLGAAWIGRRRTRERIAAGLSAAEARLRADLMADNRRLREAYTTLQVKLDRCLAECRECRARDAAASVRAARLEGEVAMLCDKLDRLSAAAE
ncbi:MAG: hypothetical protein AB7N54_13030 [Alphaproteobacteria bacterium]